ncbi:MAG: FAD-dependent oxidoreductase [Pirellulales bacterium]|nr:FAD-dependent oxidoreductase [Pirellulales bacterium]
MPVPSAGSPPENAESSPARVSADDTPGPEAGALPCDLAVIGGGSGGFGAALAAARLGVEVVLVEKADCLGGTSVRSGVNCWEMGAGGTGIPFDLYLRLKQQGNAVGVYSFGRHASWFDPKREPYRYPGGETVIDPSRRYPDTLQRHVPRGQRDDEAYRREHWHGVPFEPEAMARTMRAMLEETGHCRVLLNTQWTGVAARDGRVESATLSDGSRLRARYYVDATGDGLVCAAAGCRVMSGQESRDTFGEPDAPATATHRINGVSLLYRAARADVPAVEPLPEDIPAGCWWARRFPWAQVNHYPNGDLNVNMLPTMEGEEFLRLGYDAALEECRRRVRAHWHDWQDRFPEFRKYRLSWIAPALGVRETQRILGEYVLNENDLLAGLSGQKHPDIIALADHMMDTHGGHSARRGEVHEPYGIPYRCLIPKGYRNLLVACRAASFSSLAASSCRLSRTMIQLGQAAGTAAALARELDVDLPDVPPDRLRASLLRQHVQLEHPMPAGLRSHLEKETLETAR